MTKIANKFLNRMFRRVSGLVWDVVSGGTGLQTEQGIYTVSFAEDGTPQLNVNPMDSFGLALPAFATQASHEEVAIGDLIVGDAGILGWVVEKLPASFRLLDHNGHVKTYAPPKVAIMGTQGVLVVRNLMSLTGGAAGANNFAANLMPLLMMGGGDDKLEKLLPLLLMTSQNPQGNGGAPAAANPMASMLPFLMLQEGGLSGGFGGKMDKLLPLMMMGGFGGGAGGMNPMMMMALMGDGDIFGGLGGSKPAVPLAGRAISGVPPLTPLR